MQGTINGYGERCGNANLTSIIPAVVFRILISDQAGKSNIMHKAAKYGLNLKPDDPAMG
ncbi:MAG: hypothetical protein ACTFAL_15805 [Candidatus Electronema sp. V4]|uniref:hypothetical protein n=1 Tax=Candidatus Electronema sp. V4 TaxID=3454756 RepID=UPI00405544AF